MKNSIDLIETPRWMQDFGKGIKKPKWMGGDEGDGEGSSSGQRPAANRTESDIRRWFGGGGDGRIRL